MQYLQMIQLVLSLFPLLVKTIEAIEEAIPGSGKGEQKLAMVRGAIESTYIVASDALVPFKDLWPMLEAVINTIVTGMNAAGTFKK